MKKIKLIVSVLLLTGLFQPMFKVSGNEILTKNLQEIVEIESIDSSSYYKSLTVPLYKQDNGHYCGPATVKQTLHYINGTSKNQSDYAKLLGTTIAGSSFDAILNVVNANNSKHAYKLSSVNTSLSFSTWLSYVQSSLTKGRPCIIDINSNSYSSSWGYSTSGHFLNISGADVDVIISRMGEQPDATASTLLVKITDPHNVYYRTKWISASLTHQVNMAHFRKQIMY